MPLNRFLGSLAGLALIACVLPAAAEAQGYWDDGYGYGSGYSHAGPNERCREQRRDQQLAGALVGGVLGAAVGGLIADDGDDDRHYRHWRPRHHGYHGRGWRRHYGRHYGYHDDNDDEALGIVLGAVVGGLAGSELAGRSVSCQDTWRYPDVPQPTRSAVGPAWESGPPVYGDRHLAGAPEQVRDCELVWQKTRLPDGRMVREQVEACREGEVVYEPRTRYGDWRLER